MGIKEPVPDYGPGHFCFPAGRTPEKLIMVVSGVKMGESWYPQCGACENGYKWLYRYGPLIWASDDIPFPRWRWHFELGKTWCTASNSKAFLLLTGQKNESCRFWLKNLVEPIYFFTGGQATIVVPYDPSNKHSIHYAAQLVGVPFAPGVFDEPLAVPDGKMLHRFSRQKDGTKIYIKYEYDS